MKKSTWRSVTGIAAMAVAVTVALSGCGAITSGSSSDSDEFKLASYIQDRIDNGDPMRIKLSFGDPSIAIAVPFENGMKQAGEDLGAEVEMIGVAGGDTAKQVAQIQTLIQTKAIDALGVQTASSDALKPAIDQAFEAGIPVISYNTNSPGSKQMGFVGQDLKTVAKFFGEQLLDLLGPDASGNVILFSGEASAGWSQERQEGFTEALAGSNLTIDGPTTTTFEPSQAYNVVESTLAGKSDVAAIIGLDCCAAAAAAQWADQNNKPGIPMAGFELLPQTAKYIQEGKIAFAVSQDPAGQAYTAVKVLFDFLKNGTAIKDVEMQPLLVTIDNVNDVAVEG